MRMITLQIHAKAESRQCGPLFIMFSGLSRMFHQPEKYDSDFTGALSGFIAGRQQSVRVCALDTHESHICSKRGRSWERTEEQEREMRGEKKDVVKVAAEV